MCARYAQQRQVRPATERASESSGRRCLRRSSPRACGSRQTRSAVRSADRPGSRSPPSRRQCGKAAGARRRKQARAPSRPARGFSTPGGPQQRALRCRRRLRRAGCRAGGRRRARARRRRSPASPESRSSPPRSPAAHGAVRQRRRRGRRQPSSAGLGAAAASFRSSRRSNLWDLPRETVPPMQSCRVSGRRYARVTHLCPITGAGNLHSLTA